MPRIQLLTNARGALKRLVHDFRRARSAKKKAGANSTVWWLAISLVLLFITLGGCLNYVYGEDQPGRRIGLDEVAALASQDRLASATIKDEDGVVVGQYVAGNPVRDLGNLPSDSPAADPFAIGTFHATVPSSGQAYLTLTDQFKESGTRYVVDSQQGKKVVTTLSTFLLPLIILANLFALLFLASRGGGGAIGQVTQFGTIDKAKVKKGQSIVGFNDVGGAEEAVAELREVRDYLADPSRYEALGAATPKGVLLFGPPGTGKTLLAKAVAGEAGVPFFSVAGAEFVESLVGVGAARVRDLFARVRAAAPAIVFIDELDAAGRKRGAGGAGGSEEREQTLNQLLVEMDGFEISSGIVVMGATNRPDILDPALLRPGRFDRHITLDRPDVDGREGILHIHAQGKPIDASVNFAEVARRTPGFTGADLASVLNEATLLAIRENRSSVLDTDVEEAVFRVQHGPKRRGRLLSDEERGRAAYHEAAHALVTAAQGHLTDLHRVTILGRGPLVAATQTTSEIGQSVLSRTQLIERLLALLSGTAGERLAFGEGSTGSEHDLEAATSLARDIAARYGLSEDLGPVRLLAGSSSGFLGEDTPIGDIGLDTRSALDTEVRRLLDEALSDATMLLQRHRDVLDAVADRLKEVETLDDLELSTLLEPVTPGARSRGNGRAPSRRVPARA